MNFDDYLRDEARKYRQQAEQAEDPLIKQELLEPISKFPAAVDPL